jgi:hypothetical protein
MHKRTWTKANCFGLPTSQPASIKINVNSIFPSLWQSGKFSIEILYAPLVHFLSSRPTYFFSFLPFLTDSRPSYRELYNRVSWVSSDICNATKVSSICIHSATYHWVALKEDNLESLMWYMTISLYLINVKQNRSYHHAINLSLPPSLLLRWLKISHCFHNKLYIHYIGSTFHMCVSTVHAE